MRRLLIVFAAFVASATAGMVLSLLLLLAVWSVWLRFHVAQHQTGIGAVAGGISFGAMALTPVAVLWGVIGTRLILSRLNRNQKPD
jgi:fumarate reductase subunit D